MNILDSKTGYDKKTAIKKGNVAIEITEPIKVTDKLSKLTLYALFNNDKPIDFHAKRGPFQSKFAPCI